MKRIVAASGAAFLLLACILFAPIMKVGANTYTTLWSVWIKNSIIDNTQIGPNTPNTASVTSFSFSQAGNGGAQCGTTNNASDNSMYIECKNAAGSGSATNFVIAGLSGANLTAINLDATTVTAPAFSGPLTGNVTGNVSGTASALAATPTNCGSTAAAYGIAANGNALCVTHTSRTCNGNGCYQVGADGTITEWINTGALNNNTPTSISLPLSIPTAMLAGVCSDSGGRVQSGNVQAIGINIVGLSFPLTTVNLSTPATSVSASCIVTGY